MNTLNARATPPSSRIRSPGQSRALWQECGSSLAGVAKSSTQTTNLAVQVAVLPMNRSYEWTLSALLVGPMSIAVATADAPEVPSHLVGNYYDATDDGDACLSVQTRVVSFGSSSNDSERGCGVDMRVVGVADDEIRLLDGDRVVRMTVTEREIRFHPSAQPMCAHLGPRQFRFLRSSRRVSRPSCVD